MTSRDNYQKLLIPFLFLVGCHSSILGNKREDPKPVQVISSNPIVDAPTFNVQTPTGYTKIVFNGRLMGTDVQIKNVTGSKVDVFIRDNAGWFLLNDDPNDTYWYIQPDSSIVRYQGKYLGGQDYCIYEYVPN